VLEEEHAALTHHLLGDFEGGFVFASVIATGSRLVEAAPSSAILDKEWAKWAHRQKQKKP
jgi:hypothetical protein